MPRLFSIADPVMNFTPWLGRSRATNGRRFVVATASRGLYPLTDAERQAHFRTSLRRTFSALAIGGAVLAAMLALIAVVTSL